MLPLIGSGRDYYIWLVHTHGLFVPFLFQNLGEKLGKDIPGMASHCCDRTHSFMLEESVSYDHLSSLRSTVASGTQVRSIGCLAVLQIVYPTPRQM
jgi:hypothetical protein